MIFYILPLAQTAGAAQFAVELHPSVTKLQRSVQYPVSPKIDAQHNPGVQFSSVRQNSPTVLQERHTKDEIREEDERW